MMNKLPIGLISIWDVIPYNKKIGIMNGATRPVAETLTWQKDPKTLEMYVEFPLSEYLSADNDFIITDKMGMRKASYSLLNRDGKSFIRISNMDLNAKEDVSYYDLLLEWEEFQTIEKESKTSNISEGTYLSDFAGSGTLINNGSLLTVSSLGISNLEHITQKLTRSEYVHLHTDLWDASQMLASFPLIRSLIMATSPITVIPFKLKNGFIEFDLVSGDLEIIRVSHEQIEVKLLTKSAIVKLTTLF